MIAPKVTVEVDIVALGLRREGAIICSSLLLFGVAALASIIRHLLDGPIKLSFEHANSVDWVAGHVVSKVGVRAAQVVDRNSKALVLLCHHLLHLFAQARFAHVLSDLLLEKVPHHCFVAIGCLVTLSPTSCINLLHISIFCSFRAQNSALSFLCLKLGFKIGA